MSADRTDLRSLGSDADVTAVAALPDLDLTLLKALLGLYVLQEGSVALLMMLLNCTDHAELGGKGLESLSLSCLCKALVHVSPLEVLSVGCGL